MKAGVYEYALSLRAPVHLGHQRMDTRRGFLLRLEASGHEAWGEAAPLPGFSREGLADTRVALEALAARIAHASDDTGQPERCSHPRMPPAVRCAFHMALDQLAAARASLPLQYNLNPQAPKEIALACLITQGGEEAWRRAERAAAEGYRTLKLKVGRTSLKEDIALVNVLTKILPQQISLRLDANRAWDLTAAKAFLAGIDPARIEFLEEPLSDPAGLPELGKAFSIPLALDESLAELGAWPIGAAAEELLSPAAVLVWKPMLCGLSFTQMQDLSRRLPRLPDIVLSAAYESGVALSTFAAYAAALDNNRSAGLDTYRALAEDALQSRLALEGPLFALPQQPGTPAPDGARLTKCWPR